MIKYVKQMGDICEEFQFDTADEMICYFNYVKYDEKMNKDFYPELQFNKGDLVECVGGDNVLCHKDILGEKLRVVDFQYGPTNEPLVKLSNEGWYNTQYFHFEKVGPDQYHDYTVDNSPEFSYEQKTLDGNDRDILKQAFDKIGIKYEDHNDFLTICDSALLDTHRIDVNFDEYDNYSFKNFEEM